jgi:peptidoglycan/LPS O-acetylase OafA/YrhL
MSVALKYRSDIDGLRALAVLGVVIYHAFPHALPGGFSGVDIFFVISGYLISGILYKGHWEGGFSFGEFYARRIRRLFPALITMLVVVMGYGWVVMLPDEFSQVGKHVAAGGVFLQNVVYWKESGYFDVAANLKPLLHMWSLAVEEQFYIFFPLLLVVLWRRPKVLVPVMGVLLVVSFVVNVVMSVQNGASDFFLTPYRAWEFLGGSLLALWHYDRGHEEEAPAYREVMAWSGAVMLVGGMALLGKDQAYPGWRALVPVGGTLLVMEAGRGAWVNRRVLSHPAVVWVGLISYPLYLFHWPALSFVHIVKGEAPKAGYVWAALAVALLLTVATYYLVERSLRHNRSRWVLPSLIAAFLACALTGSLIWMNILKSRPIPSEMSKIPEAINDRDMLANWTWISPAGAKVLLYKAGGNGPQTLVVGDSNAQQYAPRLLELVKSNGLSERGVQYVTAGGTPPIPSVENLKIEGCKDLMPTFDKVLKNDSRIDRVVIAAWWHGYFFSDSKYTCNKISLGDPKGRKIALASLERMLTQLKRKNLEVILVTSIPTGRLLDPKHLHGRGCFGLFSKYSKAYTKSQFLDSNGKIGEELRGVGLRAGAIIVDPLDYLCDEKGVCIAEDAKGVPIRYDPFHLRPGYVREQVKYLDFTVEP